MKENRLPKKEMPTHWVNREEDPRLSVNWVGRSFDKVPLAEFFQSAIDIPVEDKLWVLEWTMWKDETPYSITQLYKTLYKTLDKSKSEAVDRAWTKACQWGIIDVNISDVEETITGQIQDDRLDICLTGQEGEECSIYTTRGLRQYIVGLEKDVMYGPIDAEIKAFENSIPANHKVGYYDERELPEDDMALPELEEEVIEEAPGYQIILSFHADGSYISTSDTNGDLTTLQRVGRILEALNSEYQDMEDSNL